MRLVFKENK